MSTKLTCIVLLAAACSDSQSAKPDRMVTEPTFRKAIPTRATVAIDFQGARRQALPLEAVSPQLENLARHVDKINGTIDAVFDDLGRFSMETPEVAESHRFRWRESYAGRAGYEHVLEISTDNGWDFELTYDIGPAGFMPDTSAPLTATVEVDDTDTIDAFAVTLDFDALRASDPASTVVGKLLVSLRPAESNVREVWYDLDRLGVSGSPVETSRTTYWAFAPGSGGLEYAGDIDGEQEIAYARWDSRGGRVDYYANVTSPSYDMLGSNCWGATTQELFDGFALFAQDGMYYVHVDGVEASCVHAPLDRHPNPDAQFDALPAQGDWDLLQSTGTPFCDDDPSDPDCIYYCDVFAC